MYGRGVGYDKREPQKNERVHFFSYFFLLNSIRDRHKNDEDKTNHVTKFDSIFFRPRGIFRANAKSANFFIVRP